MHVPAATLAVEPTNSRKASSSSRKSGGSKKSKKSDKPAEEAAAPAAEETPAAVEEAPAAVQEAPAAAEPAAEEAAVEEVPYDAPLLRPGRWYVVHTQSGYEKKVTANLNARIQSMNMEDKIYEIVIPMEEVDEYKNGKKQTTKDLFHEKLHSYVITDAIRDENVLKFSVEYIRTFRGKEGVEDIEVEAIDENITEKNAADLVAKADIVFGAAPLFEERFLMNRECVQQKKPLIDSAMYNLEGRIIPIVPGGHRGIGHVRPGLRFCQGKGRNRLPGPGQRQPLLLLLPRSK